jgi:hypothetical protein
VSDLWSKVLALAKIDQFNRKLGRNIAVGRLMSLRKDITGRYTIPIEGIVVDKKFLWPAVIDALIKDVRIEDNGETGGYNTTDPFLTRLKYAKDWKKLF